MILKRLPPLILSVETASENRGVVLARGAQVIGATSAATAVQHTTSLLVQVDQLLMTVGVQLKDVGLLAAATGPGSFMGLRAGLAMVKAFASTLKLPAFGVPTLHGVAYATGGVGRVLALLPAGRGEVFAQLLYLSKEKGIEELTAPFHTNFELLLKEYSETPSSLIWAGDAAHQHRDLIQARAAQVGCHWHAGSSGCASEAQETGIPWYLAPPRAGYAEQVATLALRAWEEQRLMKSNGLRALYVRQSDAELNEKWPVKSK